MDLQEFGYDLPEDLIAQYPLLERENARLMIVDSKKKKIYHDIFSNVKQYLPRESCVIINDSKVVPARLFGRKEKNGGRVEIFLLKKLSDGYSYKTLIRPLKKIKIDEKILFGKGITACLKDVKNRTVRFNKKDISEYINESGHVPLPPYIKRPDTAIDREYYQTVFAGKPGSVASPTAGLHFTLPLLKELEQNGHTIEKITLHINYSTFKPVEEQDITKHKMHSEDYFVTKNVYSKIEEAKKASKKIVAVGTTSCRVLEASATNGKLSGSTDIFIYPGYNFRIVDALITNFHLPYSTLLMLIYAFGGSKLMKKAYSEAVKKKYRFYSYGDAMIIL